MYIGYFLQLLLRQVAPLSQGQIPQLQRSFPDALQAAGC